MKVLLTGASGFVGSHILDSLLEHGHATAVLLRPSSPTQFLAAHLGRTEVRYGSVEDSESLVAALKGVTHVVHCAGRTKAVKAAEFFHINHQGTRNLVAAMAKHPAIQRLVHISSLAASGPAVAQAPASEDSPAAPVSIYGKSKLAAELEVRQNSRVPFTILRPPAVYGPRDTGFLSMFKAIQRHLLPWPGRTQALSLVYVRDLAEAAGVCLTHPAAVGKTYFVACPEVVTSRGMAKEIARQMGRWTIPFPIPGPVLWLVCLLQQCLAQLRRKATLLNLQKYAELRAPGWVCSPLKLQAETGLSCGTRLQSGVEQTLQWYRREHWL